MVEEGMIDRGEDMVSIEQFQKLLFWLQPEYVKLDSKHMTLIDAMWGLCKNPWFFGAISSTEAKQRLSSAPEGTFLVRFNNPSASAKKASVQEAPFILTRVDPWTKEIRHTYIQADGSSLLARVYVDPKHEQKMQEIRANTVQEILTLLIKIKLERNGQQVPMIEQICPGHPFQELLVGMNKRRTEPSASGYDPRHNLRRADSTDAL